MDNRYAGVFSKLANEKELIVPWLESAILADNWPDSYQIEIESGEYYGLGDGFFHPSTHSLLGARQLYYMFHPLTKDKILKEKRSLQSQMTLAMGSSIHGVVQTQFQMTGMCLPKDVEVEYINEEHHVRGKIDFIVKHPNGQTIPVELKTMNPYKFPKQDAIKPEWDAQLSLGLDNSGHEFGVLLLFEAGWPYRMKEFRVPRNDTLLSEIYNKFDYVRSCIDLDHPPKPCCMLHSQQMDNCPARFSCWLSDDPKLRP